MKSRLLTSLLTLCVTAAHASSLHYLFEASEHMMIGDEIKLHLNGDHTTFTETKLHLPSGIDLTYGEILALGDFYGLINEPISFGGTPDERAQRFQKSFDFFARDTTKASEALQIVAVIHDEQSAVAAGIAEGKKPEEIFKQISNDNNRRWNCITGGGCGTSTWWTIPGRYLELTKQDYDHFNDNAWLSYVTGHQIALSLALQAHTSHDTQQLQLAYAINAFACHFLSDRFASGHIRTPRNELPNHVSPPIAGTLLVEYMHDEENKYGIHVHNLRGDHWITYGDRSYLNPANKLSYEILSEAMQYSADDIYDAYINGTTSTDSQVEQLIPIPDETSINGNLDISPLFYWDTDKQQLMRRQDITNLYDRHWTDHWWGWSTLLLLKEQRGLSKTAQGELIAAGAGAQAKRDGLITD